jgi:UDP-N-acetylglucosamine:LPS N-acetylglucosamine transferase
MELTAAGTPFIYFPLRNHFEQNFHVVHRLDRYQAGHRLEFANVNPEEISETMITALREPVRSKSVEANGAERAARMIAQLLQAS